MEVNDSDIKDYRLHLESISCEISDIKFSLVSILNKVECNISFFVSFKEKLSVSEAYQGDVHLFESFLSELKEEILNTDAKASLLEEKTSYFSNLLEENERICSEKQTFELKTEKLDIAQMECNFSKNNVDEDAIDSRSENNEELPDGTVKSIKLSNTHLDRKRKKSSPKKPKYHQNSESLSRNSPTMSKNSIINLKLNPFDFIRFKCILCSEIFTEKQNFKKHQENHEKEYPFKCNICGLRVKEEAILEDHEEKTHKINGTEFNNELKCYICNKSCSTLSNLSRHIQRNHTRYYECPICGRNYRDLSVFDSHYSLHRNETDVNCIYCERRFINESQLKKHVSEKHEHNQEICQMEVDNKSDIGTIDQLEKDDEDKYQSDSTNSTIFDDDAKAIDYYKMDADGKNYKELQTDTSIQNHIWKLTCQICLETFSSRGCYLKHRKTHTAEELSFLSPKNKSDASINLEWEKISNSNGPSTFNCKICNKTFNYKTFVERHLLTHTGDRPYQCTSCGECYHDSTNLRRHIAVLHPSADGNLSCFTCKEQFDTMDALTEHKLTHVGEKPYQCIECGKCYSHKNNLRSHVCPAKIGKEKLFTCEICTNKYHTNFQLKVHIRKVHRKSKSEVCEYCGDTFSQKASLDRHRYIHTGGKPLTHQCSVCNKWFKESCYLKQHMNIHTGKRFFCQVCGNSFAYVKGLQGHMKKTCCKIIENSIMK